MKVQRQQKNGQRTLFAFEIYENIEILKPYPLIYKEEIEPIREQYLDDSFHNATKSIICFVQFLFLMPVCGINSDNPKNLKFKFKSIRVILTLLYILYSLFVTTLYLHFIYDAGINAMNIVGFVFFSYTTTCIIVFFIISRKWPIIMNYWARAEEKFLQTPYKICYCKLSKKIKFVSIVTIILGFIEHALFLVNSAYNQYQDVKQRQLKVDSPLSYFLLHQFGFLFAYIPFSLPIGIINELMNIALTFGWNFMEILLMIISLGLSTRFQQINQRLKAFKGKIIPEQQWIKIRLDYSSLCELVEKIDYELRYLILLSNLNNLYFICFQLLNVFETLPYTINSVYFWYSLMYLFCRTIVAQFMAASIHDSSKYPIQILKSIPEHGYCVEMQRFSDQIRYEKIALSGMKFFYLTRRTILGMIATIVTYELVLMQLNN